MSGDARRSFGAWGEQVVAERYADLGFEIVARNWRERAGEIDIVARRDATLVFCEVKTRSRIDFGIPAFAVTRDKQRRIRGLAAQFMSENRMRGVHARFDVAEVVGHVDAFTLNIIEAAF